MRARKDTVWGRMALAVLVGFILIVAFHDALPGPLGDIGRSVWGLLDDMVRWTTQAFRYKAAGT